MLILLIFKLSPNQKMQWEIKEKSEPYSSSLSFNAKHLYINSSSGLRCYDITKGSLKWSNSEIHSIHRPAIYKDMLLTGSTHSNSLYQVDAKTGKTIKSYDVNRTVIFTKLIKDNLLYFISEGNTNSYLQTFNLSDGSIDTLFVFKGNVRGPLIAHNNYIVVSAENFYPKGTLYCIDTINGKLKWEKDINVEGDLLSQHVVQYMNTLYFIDLQKKKLVNIDIMSGNINREISHSDIKSGVIGYLKGNLIVYGDKLYLYDIFNDKFKVITDKYDVLVQSSGDKIIFDYNNSIHSYDIKLNTEREIYSFAGKERYLFFANKNYILLILADNVQESLANNLTFTYVLFDSNNE